MDAAWTLGLRRFDTADAYGGGRSETWIGEWIRSTGNRPELTTKTFNPMQRRCRPRTRPASGSCARRTTSLDRLGVDRIDLYLTHEPDPDTPVAETFGALETLVDARPGRRLGRQQRRRRRPARVARARAARARPELVLAARARRRGRADPPLRRARHPLPGVQPACGRLADRQVPPRRAAAARVADDHAAEPYLHLRDDRVFDGLEALERTAAARGVGTAGLALAWALGGTDSVVVGPRSPEHLEPVREALALELSPAERDEVGSFFPAVPAA